MTAKENTIAAGTERNSADHCRISGCHSNSKSVTPAGAGGEGKEEGSSSSSVTSSSSSKKQGKSCKGCLYYSSTYRSNSRNPLCVGVSRSLPLVPQYIVGESVMEASKEGRSLTDFRYACVGYSVYRDQKVRSADGQEVQTELPVCVGLECALSKVLVDRKVSSAEAAPGRARKREEGHGVPQPRSHKPTHSGGDEFLTRFTRNANLVAMGVAKNLQKVGNQIKEGIDDIFFRRPK